MAFTYVTLQRTYETAADLPASGKVEFIPVDQMRNGLTVISAVVTATLDAAGAISIRVAATTDPATTPVGVTYKVVEKITGQANRTYYVSVPHDQGSTLQLGDLTVLTATGGAGFALRNAVDYDDSVAPSDGQSMVWDGTTSKFHPESVVGGAGAVSSVNGQTGSVSITAASLGAQPVDSDLTTIAALGPTDGSVLGRQGGAWTGRTTGQLKTDLAISNVDNTSDANKPISNATATSLAAKAPLASPTFTGTATAPRFVGAVQVVTYASSITLDASLATTFRVTATGNFTVADITSGSSGQEIWLEVLASGADRSVTIGGNTVVVAAGTWWVRPLRYDLAIDTWKLVDLGGGGGGSGGIPDDGSVTNAKVATTAAIDLDKTADSATRLALSAAERATLTGLTERIQDDAAAMLTTGVHSGISFAYNDAANRVDATVSSAGYTDEQAQDAAASLFTTATHSGISFTYNDAAGELAASVTGGGADAATPYGRVFLDDFAGADDDAKLGNALSATAADTYPRTITLRARQYDFAVGNRAAFTGMRIEGPPGYGNPERVSGTKMPGKVHLTMSGPWFHNNGATVFSVSFHQLSFIGGSSALVLGMSGSGSWYCLSMRDIFSSGLSSLLGTQATPLLITAANFTGDWEINNSYHGAIHIGGSDNTLWTDGMLLDSDPAFNTAGSANGQYHLWCDSLENSVIGPIYITCEGPWNGIRITGSAFNSGSSNAGGPLIFTGLKVEGRNAGQPCNGALIRQEGGIVTIRDCGLSFGMASPSTPGHSPADAGIVHHSGGQLNLEGCTYDRATGVAETVPFVYTNTTADCLVTKVFRASRGGTWSGRPRFAKPTANGDNRLISDATTTLINV